MTYTVSSGTLNPTIPYIIPDTGRAIITTDTSRLNFINHTVYKKLQKEKERAHLLDVRQSIEGKNEKGDHST